MAADTPEFIDPAEDCSWRSPREILARYAYSPLPPAELDDRQLPGRLWKLLYAAAARRFFFSLTDHLGDRELYTLLWGQWLDKPTADIPLEAETNTRGLARRRHAALVALLRERPRPGQARSRIAEGRNPAKRKARLQPRLAISQEAVLTQEG
jgi:hypothetical protein